jgi:RNA polymerase sigma-70 factor, ECF subfamily
LTTKSLESEFERLIKENELIIHKICTIYGVREADRQDLYQEIVLQLWRSFKNFRGESKFSTWLYRVGINTAIGSTRKAKNIFSSYAPSDLPVHADEINTGEEEQLKEMYRAIAQLNEVEKALVILYLEDRTYDEMEEIMGTSSGTLRVKMNRVKEKLRKLTKHQ